MLTHQQTLHGLLIIGSQCLTVVTLKYLVLSFEALPIGIDCIGVSMIINPVVELLNEILLAAIERNGLVPMSCHEQLFESLSANIVLKCFVLQCQYMLESFSVS